jgi:uncharacterized membrane protein
VKALQASKFAWNRTASLGVFGNMSGNSRAFLNSKAALTGWVMLTFLATLIGVVSLRYALPTVPFAATVPNFEIRHNWLVAHAVCSSIALLIGPWQFVSAIRRRWIGAHRWAGRIYCGAVLVGWIASLPVAAHANFGPISSVGFLVLGVLWAGATAQGYFTIRAGKIEEHRRWMVRSYALTAAAITLRIFLPLLPLMGISVANTYRFAAWGSWILNLILAECLLRFGRGRFVGELALPLESRAAQKGIAS